MRNTIPAQLLVVVILHVSTTAKAQVAIGYQPASSNPSLVLDISSTNKGVSLPSFQLMHVDSAKPVVSPATGLLMFNEGYGGNGITESSPFYWNGSSWKMLQNNDDIWAFGGNINTISTLNKLGTTDNTDLVFRRNNIKSGVISTSNTAFGYGSLLNTTSGSNNTAYGLNTLATNATGASNTAQGAYTMSQNNSGSFNTAFGYSTLGTNTTGSYNTAIGTYALYGMNGNYNTALGYNAMGNIATGTKNTVVGYNAQATEGLTYAVAIGTNANVTASNSMVLGGTGSNALRVGLNTWSPDTDLEVNQGRGDTAGIRIWYPTLAVNWRIFVDSATRHFNFYRNGVQRGYIKYSDGKYYATSDQRLKTDIAPIGTVLDQVLQLQPATYHYLDNPANSQYSYGFMAQEVEKLFPEAVITKEDSGLKGIAYDNVGVLAIKAIQEQQSLIDAQVQRLEELKKRLAKMESK